MLYPGNVDGRLAVDRFVRVHVQFSLNEYGCCPNIDLNVGWKDELSLNIQPIVENHVTSVQSFIKKHALATWDYDSLIKNCCTIKSKNRAPRSTLLLIEIGITFQRSKGILREFREGCCDAKDRIKGSSQSLPSTSHSQ